MQDFPKVQGVPRQILTAEAVNNLPPKLVESSVHQFNLEFTNTGQAIWDTNDDYKIEIVTDGPIIEFANSPLYVKPGERLFLPTILKTPQVEGEYEVEIVLSGKGTNKVTLLKQKIALVSPLKLNFTAKSLVLKNTEGNDFELTVLDGKSQIVYFANVAVRDGVGNIPEIHNLIPGKQYSFKLSNKHYISKTANGSLDVGNNTIRFGLIIPYDFNANGIPDLVDYAQTVAISYRMTSNWLKDLTGVDIVKFLTP